MQAGDGAPLCVGSRGGRGDAFEGEPLNLEAGVGVALKGDPLSMEACNGETFEGDVDGEAFNVALGIFEGVNILVGERFNGEVSVMVLSESRRTLGDGDAPAPAKEDDSGAPRRRDGVVSSEPQTRTHFGVRLMKFRTAPLGRNPAASFSSFFSPSLLSPALLEQLEPDGEE